MKKLLTRASALIMTMSLLCMNAIPTLAAANSTVPTIDAITTEAQSTANYLLTQDDFTALSSTSGFYHASHDLILGIRSGADCTAATTAYLNAVDNILDEQGTLDIPAGEYDNTNDIYSSYAYLLTVLAVIGKDAADYNGVNIVDTFAKLMTAASVDDFVRLDDGTLSNLNPYYIGVIYSAVDSYSELIADSDAIIAKLKAAILKMSDANGLVFWGYSADNNGSAYPAFSTLYKKDTEVKSAIDSAIEYTYNTYFNEEDGTTHYIGYGSDYASGDSTALSLALYAQYGQMERAAKSYNALLTFKLNDINGAYDGYDPIYASQNALTGLVTYLQSLKGLESPFNTTSEVTAIIAAKNNDNKPSEDTTEGTTDGSTEGEDTTGATGGTADSTLNDSADSNSANSENNSGSEAATEVGTEDASTTQSDASNAPDTSDRTTAAIFILMTGLSAAAIACAAPRRKEQ